ncbi:MAG: ribonuclease PH [Candidatus Thorarchaeota archaeon]
MLRADGRTNDQLRPIEFVRPFLKYPDGSVLVRMGDTQVICTATVENGVPDWLVGSGQGWITAEYGMLPGSTSQRVGRQASGRTYEVQRMIGRSLRAGVDLEHMGEYTIRVDCDVIQADGGTRTAAVSGACLAVHDALSSMVRREMISSHAARGLVAAVSVGILEGECVVDLTYEEDSRAGVDMNVVMCGDLFVEIQGTGERHSFDRGTLNLLLDLATKGIRQIMEIQGRVLSTDLGAR